MGNIQETTRWHSIVEKDYPTTGGTVLIYGHTEDRNMYEMLICEVPFAYTYYKQRKRKENYVWTVTIDDEDGNYEDIIVDYWMPIPELPK